MDLVAYDGSWGSKVAGYLDWHAKLESVISSSPSAMIAVGHIVVAGKRHFLIQLASFLSRFVGWQTLKGTVSLDLGCCNNAAEREAQRKQYVDSVSRSAQNDFKKIEMDQNRGLDELYLDKLFGSAERERLLAERKQRVEGMRTINTHARAFFRMHTFSDSNWHAFDGAALLLTFFNKPGSNERTYCFDVGNEIPPLTKIIVANSLDPIVAQYFELPQL